MKKAKKGRRRTAKQILCLTTAVLLGIPTALLPAQAQETIVIGESEDTRKLLSTEGTSINNFSVTDENGNYLSGAGFELYDENGTLIASWESGKESEAVSERRLDKLPVKMSYNRQTQPDLFGENMKRMGYYKIEETGAEETGEDWTSIFQYGIAFDSYIGSQYTLHFGTDYTLSYKYSKAYEPTYTLPANHAGIYVSENYNKGDGKSISIYRDMNDAAPVYQKSLSNASAGEFTAVETGEGSFHYGISKSNANSAVLETSAEETHYVKRTCKLADLLRDALTHIAKPSISGYKIKQVYDNGTMLAGYGSDTEVIINMAQYGAAMEDGYILYPRLLICSGAVINEVVPDADGNVTLYLSTDTIYSKCNYSMALSTNRGDAGGEVNGAYLSADEWVETSVPFSLADIAPENGLTLFLDTGSYTLKQTYAPDGYEKAADKEFTIYHRSNELIVDQTFKVINSKSAEEPTTEAPATETPSTETPATEAPSTETQATEAPSTETQTTEAAVTEAPATESKPPQTEVKTGDVSPVHIVIICLMASLAGILVLTVKFMKREKR